MTNNREKNLICVLLLAAGCSSGGYRGSGGATVVAPKAYVGLFGDSALAVIDTGSNRLIRTIAIPAGPHGLVITPDGAKVFVSSDGASTVSVVDTATDAVVASIEGGRRSGISSIARRPSSSTGGSCTRCRCSCSAPTGSRSRAASSRWVGCERR